MLRLTAGAVAGCAASLCSGVSMQFTIERNNIYIYTNIFVKGWSMHVTCTVQASLRDRIENSYDDSVRLRAFPVSMSRVLESIDHVYSKS